MEYAREKLTLFSPDARLSCREIGDGNINFIFRVTDEDSGGSVIIKHSDTRVRSTNQVISLDHNRIEAEILELQMKLAPGLVPKLYLYDPVMCCMCMEDLRDYENMRHAMVARRSFPGFAEQITDFMACTLIRTTDSVMIPSEKKELVKRFMNPDLCEVTERLVFTEPYLNVRGRNKLTEGNRAFLERELYEDRELQLEVAKLKESFKSNAQSLIHGDLHTGSIMVKPGSTMVLDPEFACYAPAGYDVGNLVANLIFAWASAQVTMELGGERSRFISWVEESIVKSVDLFREKAVRILTEEATDPMARTPGFAGWYVAQILQDSAGVAGCELNRRVIGAAKVRDLTGIADEDQRAVAERICVLTAKQCIMNRAKAYQQGEDYISTLRAAAEKAKRL